MTKMLLTGIQRQNEDRLKIGSDLFDSSMLHEKHLFAKKETLLGYELEYIVDLTDGVITLTAMGSDKDDDDYNALLRALNRRIDSNVTRTLDLTVNLNPGCTKDSSNAIISTIRSRNNAYVCCELHPGAVEVYRITAIKNIHRLALDGICNRDALRDNFGKDGWMSNLEQLEKAYDGNYFISNLRLVPTQRINSPQGVYYKFALYHVGDPIDYSEVVDGVRIAAHYRPRHRFYLYATDAMITSTEYAARYISRIISPSWVNKQDEVPMGYTAYLDTVNNRHHEYHKNVIEAFSSPKSMELLEIRGLVDGAVQTVLVSGFYAIAAQYTNAHSTQRILEDYAALRQYVQRTDCNEPPEPTYELLYNKLIVSTLLAILSNNMLIIANKKFYRRLRHLGLILNERELDSNANRVHIWRLLAQYRPDLTFGEVAIVAETTIDDPIATLTLEKFKMLTWSTLTRIGNVLRLECILRPQEYRKVIETFRFSNIDIKEQYACQLN